jgi:hypothetical protein
MAMALNGSPNFVVLWILSDAGRDKAPLPRTVEAGSSFMHDSDIFQWMKPVADVLRLTGFASGARRAVPQRGREKPPAAAEP